MQQNRRGDRRVALDLEIDYSDLESFCQDYIRNISRGGVFVETREPLALGSNLKLKFRLPGSDRPIQAEGVVMWVIEAQENMADGHVPGMGIRFGSLSEQDMAMIDELVLGELTEE